MEGRFANMEFRLGWESDLARHAERLYVPKMDFRKDIVPGGFVKDVMSLSEGENCGASLLEGELVPGRSESLVRQIRDSEFQRRLGMLEVEPQVGRYYPRILIAGVAGIASGDYRPFRVLDMAGEHITVDLNHPLAGRSLHLQATLMSELPSRALRGSPTRDLAEMVSQKGPGMEALDKECRSDFFSDYPFSRLDDNPDADFYRMPRLVGHVDAVASREIGAIYGRLIEAGSRVLDLMSSWQSHLPEGLALDVAGLGLNEEELQRNPRLSEHVLRDLNREPRLPYEDGSLDAVVCANSVEYLTRPLEVVDEIARVLKPGGRVIFAFSERWFPPKVIRLWTELHPFERMGLVLETLYKSGRFDDINSETVRGYPRPEDDKYRGMTPHADPVYAVWASCRSGTTPT